MNQEQKRARASKAGAASQSVSSYVQRITRRAPELSPSDIDALRQLVGPIDAADVYIAGLRQGARLAADKVMELVGQVDPS